MWGFLQFTKYLWLMKFNLFGPTFLSLTKGSHIWWTLYISSITHGFWRHESALLIHPYLHTITRTVKRVNPCNDAVHYVGWGQLLYILVFPFTWEWVSRTYSEHTYEHIIIYYFILMLILEMHRKSLLKYMLENFEKLQSLKLFSVYLLIVPFVFVRRILSRSHPDLKSITVFIEIFCSNWSFCSLR